MSWLLSFFGPWLYIVIAAGSFAAAWQTQNWRHAYQERKTVEQIHADQLKRIERQDVKAEAYEKAKVVIRTKFVPITQEVERVVNTIEYRDRACLDDAGLRLANQAIGAAAPAASEPARAVSGSQPTR